MASRAVLVLLPLTLIDALDYASNVLKMHRTDVIRRSLMRDVNSLLWVRLRGLKDIRRYRAGQVSEDDRVKLANERPVGTHYGAAAHSAFSFSNRLRH